MEKDQKINITVQKVMNSNQSMDSQLSSWKRDLQDLIMEIIHLSQTMEKDHLGQIIMETIHPDQIMATDLQDPTTVTDHLDQIITESIHHDQTIMETDLLDLITEIDHQDQIMAVDLIQDQMAIMKDHTQDQAHQVHQVLLLLHHHHQDQMMKRDQCQFHLSQPVQRCSLRFRSNFSQRITQEMNSCLLLQCGWINHQKEKWNTLPRWT